MFLRIIRTTLIPVFLCLVACAPSMRIKPGEIPAATLPTTEDKAVSESYVQQYVSQEGHKELTKGKAYQRVSAIVSRLNKAAGFPANIFPIHLVDAGEEVNAMVVAGSSIVVYKMLLEKVKNDDELAVILGHELGHVLGRHHAELAEQQTRSTAVSIGSTILGTAASVATSLAGYHGVSDIAGGLTETTTGMIGYGAFVGSFDRRQEYEADHLGLLLMAKAGYDPHVAISFWERSQEVFGERSSEVGAFFSTHPAEGNRVEAIREALPLALSYYKAPAPQKKAAAKK